MQKKTLLIIGGSGFFGKSILSYFSKKKNLTKVFEKIIIISRKNFLIDEIKNLKKKFIIKKINTNLLNLKEIPKADYILYCALLSDFKKDQLVFKKFCTLIKKFNFKSKILYISSGAVYGKQPQHIKNIKEIFIKKRQVLKYPDFIKSKYAKCKINNENELKKLKKFNINISIARCFSFVGKYLPRGKTNITKGYFAGNIIDNILSKKPLILKSHSPVIRSYMYSDDLVEWLLKIVKKSDPSCPTYNVGSDDGIYADKLANFLSKKYRLPIYFNITNKKVDKYVPNIDKAKKELKLSVNYSSYNAIIKTIRLLKKYEKKN